jgi:hybrid cluster-associated redox disulfide protein
MEPEKNNETTASAGRITKETLLYDLLQKDPDTAEILMGAGMGCIYCPASLYETIEQACQVHGIDADDLVEEINTFLDSQA